MTNSCRRRTSKVLLRLGQILLLSGIICFTISTGTAYWVVRPTVDIQKLKITPNKTLVVENYGIFVACRRSEVSVVASMDCGSLLDNLSFINEAAVRYIQFLMCLALLLYAAGLFLEVIQCMPIKRFRNLIAQNRIVEMFAAIANVMALQGMIMFAGEIKNKAERLPGQDAETPGWSFAVAVAGLTLSIIGLLLATMFRDLPVTSPAESGGSWLRPASRSPTIHAVVR